MAAIMARGLLEPPHELIIKTQEKEGPDRGGFPQNLGSPRVSRWPAPETRGPLTAPPFIRDTPGSGGFTIGQNFLGSQLSDSGFTPPDSMGTVGPTQVFETVNGRFRVFSKAGVMGPLDVSADAFFSPLLLSLAAGTRSSDPRVKFDRFSNRWFISMISVEPQDNHVLIAVSDGPTITSASSFTFYMVQQNVVTPAGDAGSFLDYDTLGLDANALYIGGNMFAGDYTGTDGFVVQKSSILNGGPIVVTAFRGLAGPSGTSGLFTPQGVDNDNPNASVGYFIGVSNNQDGLLAIRKVLNPGTSPTISAEIDVTVPQTAVPSFVQVLGSAKPIDALDDRLFMAKLVTNQTSGVQTLWAAHNILIDSTGAANQSGDRVGSRWYQIGSIASSPSLIQSGTEFDSATASPNSLWIPSITMTGQGYSVFGCSIAGQATNVGAVYAYQVPGIGLGLLSATAPIVGSSTSYNTSETTNIYRWGDYSHTVVDPTDDMTVWSFQEYCSSTNQYGVRVTQFIAPPPPAITGLSPNLISPGSTQTITVNASGVGGSAFFDPGSTFPKHLVASFSGTGVTVNSFTITGPSQLKLSITVASAALTGARTLTITNPDGQKSSLANAIELQSANPVIGTATLGDYTGNPSLIILTVQVRNPGSTTPIATQTVALDSSGNFDFSPSVPAGSYDLAFQGGSFLRAVVHNVVLTATRASGVNVSLINGDANGDNAVTFADVRLVLEAFGSRRGFGRCNPNCDMNGDGVVDGLDLSIVLKNLGLVGAP